jgi:hypothetical protein
MHREDTQSIDRILCRIVSIVWRFAGEEHAGANPPVGGVVLVEITPEDEYIISNCDILLPPISKPAQKVATSDRGFHPAACILMALGVRAQR